MYKSALTHLHEQVITGAMVPCGWQSVTVALNTFFCSFIFSTPISLCFVGKRGLGTMGIFFFFFLLSAIWTASMNT